MMRRQTSRHFNMCHLCVIVVALTISPWLFGEANGCESAGKKKICRGRDEAAVSGMTCGRPCDDDSNCPGSQPRCVCDGPCGKSCVDPAVVCLYSDTVAGSKIEYSGYGICRTAHYFCDDGYMMASGSPVRSCTGGGTWLGELPTCRRIQCEDPSAEMRSRLLLPASAPRGPYFVGDRFSFTCPDRSTGSWMCQKDGSWRASAGDCKPTATARATSDSRCGNPEIPTNGRSSLKGNGDAVVFACNRGFRLVGRNEQKCLRTRRWSGSGPPKCIDPRSRTWTALTDDVTTDAGLRKRKTLEIHFAVDVSPDATTWSLRNSLEFAAKLAKKMSRESSPKSTFSLHVFSSTTRTVSSYKRNVKMFARKLMSVADGRWAHLKSLNRDSNEVDIPGALQKFRVKPSGKTSRIVFVLTNGAGSEISAELTSTWSHTTFYAVTSCAHCANPAASNTQYDNLLAVGGGRAENVLYVHDSSVPRAATFTEQDWSECGIAGAGISSRTARVERVLGGKFVLDRTWPWQAVVTVYNPRVVHTYDTSHFLGGGSLINNRWILTAAHIFNNIKERVDWQTSLAVTLGMRVRPVIGRVILPDVKIFHSRLVVMHERFNQRTVDFDIALVRIGSEVVQNGAVWSQVPGAGGWVNYTAAIRPVCLPCNLNSCVQDVFGWSDALADALGSGRTRCSAEGDWLLGRASSNRNHALVTGFGHTRPVDALQTGLVLPPSSYLKETQLWVRDERRCREAAERAPAAYLRKSYTENMFCATSTEPSGDTCRGDSGGPIVRQVFNRNSGRSCWVQIGLVSWGYGCGQSYNVVGTNYAHASFSTRVSLFTKWIEDTTSQS